MKLECLTIKKQWGGRCSEDVWHFLLKEKEIFRREIEVLNI